MTAQPFDLDIHVGEERQLQQGVVQFLDTGQVKYAVVGVVPGDAPQVAPFAFLLQAPGQLLFVRLELRGLGRVHVQWQVYSHFYVEKHGVLLEQMGGLGGLLSVGAGLLAMASARLA